MAAPRLSRAVALVLALAAIGPVPAQERGTANPVEILPADTPPSETDPGVLLTVPLFVSNRNSEETAMLLALEVPEGWRAIGGGQELDLAVKAGDTVIASFRVASAAPAGDHAVRVVARGRRSGTTLGSLELSIRVRTVAAIEVVHLDAPSLVIAGELYTSRFTVSNRGNAAFRVAVSVRSSPAFETLLDAEPLALEPGAARAVAVAVRTPADLTVAASHYLHLTARAEPESGEPVSAHASSGVEVLPRITGTTRLYDTLPLKLTATQALVHGGANRYAFRGRVEAGGPLLPSGDDRFSFLLDLPLDELGSIFPEPPAVSVGYATPRYSVRAGTGFFALSSLTERSMSGAGLEASLTAGRLRIGGYHVLPVTAKALATETAGYATIGDPEGSVLRLNLLEKRGLPTPRDQVFILGAQAIWRHPSGATLEAEYASAAAAGGADALRLGVSGTRSGLSYQLSMLRAASDYPGATQDREEYGAALGFSLLPSLQATATAKRERAELDLPAPTGRDTASAGLSWAVDDATAVRISVQRAAGSGGVEESGRLTLSRKVPDAAVSLGAEVGLQRNGAEAARRTERYRASASFDPLPAVRVGAALTLERASAEITADVTWAPARSTQIRLSYRAAEKPGSYYAGTESLRLDASHRFPGGVLLSARGDYAPDRSLRRPTDFSARAEVVIPLGLPLRRRAVGRIGGTVRDADTLAGVPEVILRIGGRIAVTDLRGTFLFPDLPPGTYYLTVDTSRIGKERLVAQKPPLSAVVEAGKEQRVELTLVAPARLGGTLRRYRTTEGGGFEAAAPLADQIVELRRNGDLRRTLTGRDGSVAFTGLPPGSWRLTVSTAGLPPYTALAENGLTFDLGPGDALSFEARVLDVRREMRIVDEGELIEEAPPPARPGNGGGPR